MRLVNPNPADFQNMGVGATTATMTLQSMPRYLDQIDLIGYIDGVRMTQAEVIANASEIEIKLFGNTQRLIEPTRHIKIDTLKGQAFRAGRVSIRFTQPERRSAGGEDRTALEMDRVGPLTINIKQIANGIAATRTWDARLLTRPLRRDQIRDKTPNPIVTYTEQNIEVSASGQKTDTYTPPAGRAISMFHCLTDQITAMKVYLGELVLYDFPDKQSLDDFLIDNGYTPQADIWSCGGELFSSRMEDWLLTGDKVLKFEWTMASAANFTMLVEEIGQPKI